MGDFNEASDVKGRVNGRLSALRLFRKFGRVRTIIIMAGRDLSTTRHASDCAKAIQNHFLAKKDARYSHGEHISFDSLCNRNYISNNRYRD